MEAVVVVGNLKYLVLYLHGSKPSDQPKRNFLVKQQVPGLSKNQ